MNIDSVSVDPNDPNKLIIDFTYTPVQPIQYINMTISLPPLEWRSHLKSLTYLQGHWQDDLISMTEAMQAAFPGNYTVECYTDHGEMRILPRLRFDTPQDETWFMLRYSS